MNDLQLRLLKFSTGVYAALSRLPANPDLRDNRSQLMRSSSSPGAHYGEAQSASTRKDFVYKIGAVLKELRESLYWLLYFCEIYPRNTDLKNLSTEADELVRIFATILKKSSLGSTLPPGPSPDAP
jgi:four helix bundle protein